MTPNSIKEVRPAALNGHGRTNGANGHNNGGAGGHVVALQRNGNAPAVQAESPILAPTSRVLYIGATGRVGHQVIPLLGERFEFTAAALGGGQVAGAPVVDVDITDMASVEEVVRAGDENGEPFDAIVNCAIADSYFKKVNAQQMHEYEEQCIEVNARGAYHIFEAAKRAGVPRVVYVSSMTALMGHPRYPQLDGETLDRPRDVYAACKMFGENVGRTYAYPRADGQGLQVSCLRLGMPYPVFTGSDKGWQYDYGRRAVAVHIEDVARSIACALDLAPAVRYGVYCIVSDSDNPYVSPELYQGLGYSPGWRFSEGTLTSIPLGDEAPIELKFEPREKASTPAASNGVAK